MAKEVIGKIKLQLEAGKANPAPPVGPASGQHGVNIPEFCKAFNAQTQDKMGFVIPVEISVYADRSFTFILKTAFIFSLETIKISFIVSSISFLYFSIASFTREELQFSNNVPFDRSAASVFLKYILYSTSFTVPVFSKIFNIFSHNSEALTSIFKLLQKLFVI